MLAYPVPATGLPNVQLGALSRARQLRTPLRTVHQLEQKSAFPLRRRFYLASSTFFHLHFDGAAKDKVCTGGAIIHKSANATWNPDDPSVRMLWQGRFIFPSISSEGESGALDAEYAALIEGLYAIYHMDIALDHDDITEKSSSPIQVHGDSNIVLQHLAAGYGDKRRRSTRDLFRLASSLLTTLSRRPNDRQAVERLQFVNLTHVPRHLNAAADALATAARTHGSTLVKSYYSLPMAHYKVSPGCEQGGILIVRLGFPSFLSNPNLDVLTKQGLRSQLALMRLRVNVCGEVETELALPPPLQVTGGLRKGIKPQQQSSRTRRRQDTGRIEFVDSDDSETQWVFDLPPRCTPPRIMLQLIDTSRPSTFTSTASNDLATCCSSLPNLGICVSNWKVELGVDMTSTKLGGALPPVPVCVNFVGLSMALPHSQAVKQEFAVNPLISQELCNALARRGHV